MALEYKHAVEQMQRGYKLHLARRLKAGDGLQFILVIVNINTVGHFIVSRYLVKTNIHLILESQRVILSQKYHDFFR